MPTTCGAPPGSAGQHDGVAQPAQAVAQRVEDIQAEQPGDEDAGGFCAHPLGYRVCSL